MSLKGVLKMLHGRHVATLRIATENPVLDSVSTLFRYPQLGASKVCSTCRLVDPMPWKQLETLLVLYTPLKCLKIWKVIGQIATTSSHSNPKSNGFIEKGARIHSSQVYKLRAIRDFLQHSCATLMYIL
eukprot:s137_g23.t1